LRKFHTCNAGRVGNTLHETAKQSIDILQIDEKTRGKRRTFKGRCAGTFNDRSCSGYGMGHGSDCRSFTQIVVFLEDFEMIGKRVQPALGSGDDPIAIFGRINAGLFRITKRFRTARAQGYEQDIGPFFLNLLDKSRLSLARRSTMHKAGVDC